MSGAIDDPVVPADHGALPQWNVADLPAPPPFGFRNILHVIGPGAIMAATSIGGGEWLVGPAAAVKYSSAIFLIATVAIFLQVIFNIEATGTRCTPASRSMAESCGAGRGRASGPPSIRFWGSFS